MKISFTLVLIFIFSLNKCWAQDVETVKTDTTVSKAENRNNSFKNTLSWDISNILHSVNLTYYNNAPAYTMQLPNGNSYYSLGGSYQSGFPASVYYRHQLKDGKRIRRDRFKYFRANLSLSFASYKSADSSMSHTSTQVGNLTVSNPKLSNNYFSGNISVGLEWAYVMGKFQLYYALDFISSYYNYHNFIGSFNDNSTNIIYDYYNLSRGYSFGLSPGIGFNFYMNPRLMIGIEAAYVQLFNYQKNSVIEINESSSDENHYKLPNNYATFGSFIPLRAIKLGFNF